MAELEEARAEHNEIMEQTRADHEEDLSKERERVEQLEDDVESAAQLQTALESRVSELEEELQRLQGDLKDVRTTHELESEETRRRSIQEGDQERIRQDMEQAVMREQIKLARRNAANGGGKYKYQSKLVSQLIGAGQLAVPRGAPPLLKREEILESLDVEEIRSALRYNIICVGAQHTGKSSVQKLLSHTGGGGLIKKAPDVVTPSTCFSRAEFISKDKGSSKGFSIGKKHTVNTYFNVWDTPCDPRVLQALPQGALPASGCAYVATFFLNHEFHSEAKKVEEVLLAVHANVSSKLGNGDDGANSVRIPVVLVGTRKDLLQNSKDGLLAIKKISESKKWFRENPVLKEKFRLIDSFAVSIKDWSVQNDTGSKTGVSSFAQVMSLLSTELQSIYPITPPALLGYPASPSTTSDIADYCNTLSTLSVSNDKAREEKSIFESMFVITILLHRMRLRGSWMVGAADVDALIADNVPSFSLESHPDTLLKIKEALRRRSDMFTCQDTEYPDPREAVTIINPLLLCNFVDTLMLPSLYLSLVESFASDKPGHLKANIQKSSGFNLEEFWRPDWELVFDGRISGTVISCLFKLFLPFKKDPVLGKRFLGLLGMSFTVGDAKSEVEFMPGLALATLSGEVQSLLLSLFKKEKGEWSARTASRAVPPAVLAAVMQKIVAKDKNALLWRDGAAFNHNGTWGYLKCEANRVSLCCEGKGTEVLSEVQALIDQELTENAAAAAPAWKDGMLLDEIPRLSPSLAKEVDDTESIQTLLKSIPKDKLRGTPFPSATVDADMRRMR